MIGRASGAATAGVVLGLVVATLAACAALVGVGDVPVPEDGAANPDETGPDASADASSDATALDAPAPQPDAESDTSVGSGDAALDAPGDVEVPDAFPDAAIAALCPATWQFYDPDCNRCGQQFCCDKLAACEVADEAGVDGDGGSRCKQFVYCVTGYQGSRSDGEAICMASYSSAELTLGNAALSCIRASCPTLCAGL